MVEIPFNPNNKKNVFLSRFIGGLSDSGQLNVSKCSVLYFRLFRYELCPYVIILAIDIVFFFAAAVASSSVDTQSPSLFLSFDSMVLLHQTTDLSMQYAENVQNKYICLCVFFFGRCDLFFLQIANAAGGTI